MRGATNKKILTVWLVQIGEQIPVSADIRKLRALYLAEALIAKGHNVIWITSAFNHLRKVWVFDKDTVDQIDQKFKIVAIKGIGYKKNISVARFIDHRILSLKFRSLAQKLDRPDIVVASSPPYDLAYEAARFTHANNIPLVIDIRDKWPSTFVSMLGKKFEWLLSIILWNEFRMLAYAFNTAQALIGISEELLKWGQEMRNSKKLIKEVVLPLGFEINKNYNSNNSNLKKRLDNLELGFVVTFVGTFGRFHNPEIIVDAAKILKDENVSFLMVGDGENHHYLQKKAKDLKNVHFLGWLDMPDIALILKYSHLGVCPTGQQSERDFFPNKVFLYWGYGLPIASMFKGQLNDVIQENKTGFNFNTSHQLATGIMSLINDKNRYSEMKINTSTLFKNKYEAKKLYGDFTELIENVAKAVRKY